MATWKRRITDKFPKLTRRETMIVIILLLLTSVIIFTNISFKANKDGFSCNSDGNIKIGEKK